jgi:hypothetical protein
MLEADGTIDRLDVTVPVATEGSSGSFTFEVETGPSGGPYIPVGTVTVLQGATSGTAVINPVHAYAGDGVFVVNQTAVGVMPGGTPTWNSRFAIHVRTTNT